MNIGILNSEGPHQGEILDAVAEILAEIFIEIRDLKSQVIFFCKIMEIYIV